MRFRAPGTGRHRPWHFRVADKEVPFEPRTRYAVNEGSGLAAAASLGLGLVQLPDYMVRDEIAAGKLEEALARFRPRPLALLRDALVEMK